jgi:hypothetical protein
LIVLLIAVKPVIAGAEGRSEAADNIARLIEGGGEVRIIDNGPGGVTLEADGSRGWTAGSLTLTPQPSTWACPRIITPSFYVLMNVHDPEPTAMGRLAEYARTIVERDDGSGGYLRQPFRGEPMSVGLLWTTLLATTVAIILVGARWGQVVVDLRLPHAVPTLIQTTLFVYWWLYWPGVGQRVPSILLQIELAYATDAILSLGRERTWRLGLGPLPIVLSANLFAWFTPLGSVVVVVAAVASRTFLRRGGRHVFNPSAAGLTLAGLLSLASPMFTYEPTFHTLSLAPNMAEMLILLTLIPQIRFRIVLVSVGAVVGLALAGFVFTHFPALGMPGTLITFALFATDPATIPRTPAGQLLFGTVVGAGMAILSTLLTAAGLPDVFAKVFPIPIANLLAPRLDALGRQLSLEPVSLLAPRWNAAHLVVWLALVVPQVCTSKANQFLMAPHWTYHTPLVAYRATNALRCEDNPTFCRPFTFVREISGWLATPAAS